MGSERVLALAFCGLTLAAQEAPVGRVLLSDGRIFRGEVRLGGTGRLGLFVPAAKRRYRLRLPDISRLETEVVAETLAQGWLFAEESSPRKIRLPFFYPLRRYRTRVTLKTGQVLVGDVEATTLYVEGPDEDEEPVRFILRTYAKGQRGQRLEDLVYIREVALGEAAAQRSLFTLTGRLPGGGEVVALDTARGHAVRARTNKNGSFRLAGLLAGRYRLFAAWAGQILAGWREPGNPTVPAGLKTLVTRTEEFFEAKAVRLARISGDRAELLVEMRRLRPTSYNRTEKGVRFLRWELWEARRYADGWHLERRCFLFRRLLRAAAALAFKVTPRRDLAEVTVTGDVTLGTIEP